MITDRVSPTHTQDQDIQFYQKQALHYRRRRIEKAIYQHFRWVPYTYQVIRQVRPKLIHAHFGKAGEGCLWSARWLHVPLIVNFYGIETNRQIHDPVWLGRYRRLYAQANAFICSSNAMKEAMVVSGCPSEKITIIRCGVDTDFFCGDVTPWQRGQPLRLLSIARWHPDKGLRYLLEACRLLNMNGMNNWQLDLIGFGPLEMELKRQAEESGIQEQVHFLGPKSPTEVRAALHRAHLMILPSLKETQGVALQEAQATRTPVIASNIGGIPEGVLDGESGFLIDPQSPQAIMEKINMFLEQPNLFAKMGHAGRRYVTTHFSRQKEYRQLSELYRRVIDS
ncbi:MAG: glycosyltransferase family 4 protein [Ardenticatenaceae bacterium]